MPPLPPPPLLTYNDSFINGKSQQEDLKQQANCKLCNTNSNQISKLEQEKITISASTNNFSHVLIIHSSLLLVEWMEPAAARGYYPQPLEWQSDIYPINANHVDTLSALNKTLVTSVSSTMFSAMALSLMVIGISYNLSFFRWQVVKNMFFHFSYRFLVCFSIVWRTNKWCTVWATDTFSWQW